MIDVYCINDDGNVIDASSLGVVAALQLSKLPIYDEENDQVKYGELSETPIPLTKNIPLAMTFYKVGNNILFDPTRDEEDASEARITMAITSPDKDKIINSMQKGGITPISIEEMNTIIEEAEKIYDKLFPEVEKMVENLK